ncbi:FAD-dependent monooxygenase [Flavobacteriaceae bacterium]|nr:FAD-dependent monooxygenase [Flavobacteriaceae bacterium]
MKDTETCWASCIECKGLGKKKRRLRKSIRLRYQRELAQFDASAGNGAAPVRPIAPLDVCSTCKGSGLVAVSESPHPDKAQYPHIAIIGGGIGGIALGVACLHRKIPFTLYERDQSFDARSQGYGLTLQQASAAMKGLGVSALAEGVVSTKHVVHTTEGKILGEWGMRKWLAADEANKLKKSNIHIARQSLRSTLIKQLGGSDKIHWGHQLIDFNARNDSPIELKFEVNGIQKTAKADLVVGADGIRSRVRNLVIGEKISPLNYLGCIVILGICPLKSLEGLAHPLLDSATVFQTANGHERIYIMPYTKDSIMWQLSFPLEEEAANSLSRKGAKALKKEACKRVQWHDPIPQILAVTSVDFISGYPVYDRALLQSDLLENAKQATLIGDAAHPMSPFKGQGANQAILDALALAREITKGCSPKSEWQKNGIRSTVLTAFESEMLARTSIKVMESAAAAHFLHSDAVLQESDAPRGRHLKPEWGY